MMENQPSDHEDRCRPILIPGEVMCVDDDNSLHPVTWIYTLQAIPVFPADGFALASNNDNSVQIPLVPVAVFAVVVVLLVTTVQDLVWKKKGIGQGEPHVYIRVFLKTKKAMAAAVKEIKNILPFLERHYGCSAALINLKERHITLFVKQDQGLTPFPVRALVRDIMSPLSIQKLKGSAEEVGRPLKVFVLTGMTADRQEINRAFSTARFPDNMAHNTGEIILRFPEKKVEEDIFRKLQRTRKYLEGVLCKHRLLLEDIREGSIHFKIRLSSPSESLDELAHDQRIIRIAKDFFSHQSFGRLASSHKVTAEFTCNVKMEKVSVLTAKTLHVQIGKRNKVKVVAAPEIRSDHTDDDQQPDESYVIYADDSLDVTAAVTSAVSFQASPKNHQRVPDNGGPGTSIQPHQIRIVVQCKDDRLASSLLMEWENVLALLLNHHPGWSMAQSGRRIVWDQKASHGIRNDQIFSFLFDLFSIERVSHLVQDHFPHVNVHFGRALEQAIDAPPEERQLVQPRHTFMKLLLIRINDCFWLVMNFCYRLVIACCHFIIVYVLIDSFYDNIACKSFGL